jgi:hypothetical protein
VNSLLLIISPAFVGLIQAASCGGSCAIGTSYDFLGDPSIGMDTVGGLESPLRGVPLSPDPSQNQTGNAYTIKNSFVVRPMISSSLENMTSDIGQSHWEPQACITRACQIWHLLHSETSSRALVFFEWIGIISFAICKEM